MQPQHRAHKVILAGTEEGGPGHSPCLAGRTRLPRASTVPLFPGGWGRGGTTPMHCYYYNYRPPPSVRRPSLNICHAVEPHVPGNHERQHDRLRETMATATTSLFLLPGPDIYRKRTLHSRNTQYICVKGSGADAATPGDAAASAATTTTFNTTINQSLPSRLQPSYLPCFRL